MQNKSEATDGAKLVSNRTMDIAVAILFLGASLLVILDSTRLGFRWQDGIGPGAGYFPFYIALVMAGASLINLARAVFDVHGGSGAFVTRTAFGKVLAVLLPLIAFVIAIAFIGIYLSAAIFIALFMMYFGKYQFYKAAPVGAGVALVLFFLFEKWFLVPLPKGPVETWLGY